MYNARPCEALLLLLLLLCYDLVVYYHLEVIRELIITTDTMCVLFTSMVRRNYHREREQHGSDLVRGYLGMVVFSPVVHERTA